MPEHKQYPVPQFGLASEFPDTERPAQYASVLTNRYINPGGGAAKRQGLRQLGATLTQTSAPNITTLHELVESQGSSSIIAAACGKFYRYNAGAWNQAPVYSGFNASARARSIQFDDKLIFCDGTSRPVFTTDASGFRELTSLIIQGSIESTADATAHDRLKDSTNAPNWLTTQVAINDALFDATISAYAIITDVKSSSLAHTPMTAASEGVQGSAAVGGHKYEIHDLVQLNIINTEQQNPTNIAVIGAQSSPTKISVTAGSSAAVGFNGRINFGATEIRLGDFIRNTTRNQVARVTKVSATEITHTTVASQAVGDSVIFLKDAMPIPISMHAHFGRAYYLDSRDHRKVRISGPQDPQDMSTDAGTLDSISFKLGAQQGAGDELLRLGSFQSFLIVGGRRNTYLFSGINPIVDASGGTNDLKPVSLFPQGLASRDSLITVGNDGIVLTPDGLQSFGLYTAFTTPTRELISEALRTEIRVKVSSSDEVDILVRPYPKRNMVWVKTPGSTNDTQPCLYIFNYGANLFGRYFLASEINQPGQKGSWSKFTGRLAEMNDYFLTSNSQLLTCDSSGRVFTFDTDGVYDDAGGSAYPTRLQTAWLPLDESAQALQGTRAIKSGVALLPQMQGSAKETYTIAASGGWETGGGETVTVPVSLNDASPQVPRVPLKWRGERLRLTIDTTSNTGPDIIGSYTVRYNRHGVI